MLSIPLTSNPVDVSVPRFRPRTPAPRFTSAQLRPTLHTIFCHLSNKHRFLAITIRLNCTHNAKCLSSPRMGGKKSSDHVRLGAGLSTRHRTNGFPERGWKISAVECGDGPAPNAVEVRKMRHSPFLNIVVQHGES